MKIKLLLNILFIFITSGLILVADTLTAILIFLGSCLSIIAIDNSK